MPSEGPSLSVARVAKTLVIAEKPSVGARPRRALPGTLRRSNETLLESDDYVDHVGGRPPRRAGRARGVRRALQEVAAGRPADRPARRFKLRPRDAKSKKQLKVIHKLLKRDDVERVDQRLRRRARGRADLRVHLRDVSARAVDEAGRAALDLVDDEAGDPRGLREAAPGRAARSRSSEAARSRSEADWLVGMNATRAATITRPRLGRRRRLARPRADADARDDRQARARDPGVRPRAVLARPRDLRPALRGPLVRGRRDAAQGRRARRRDRRARRGQGRARSSRSSARSRPSARRSSTTSPRCSATPTGASASPRAARCRPRSRCTRARRRSRIRAPSSRFLSGDMVPQLKPTAAHAAADLRVRGGGARSSSGLDQLPLGRVVNDAKVDDHHAIIPTDIDARLSARSRRTSGASST